MVFCLRWSRPVLTSCQCACLVFYQCLGKKKCSSGVEKCFFGSCTQEDLSSFDNWCRISLLDVMGKVFCNQQRLQAIVEEVHVADSQCSLQCNCEWTPICVKTPLFQTLCLLLLFARSLTTIVFNNCKIHKTLVNGWRQPLLYSNKNCYFFSIYKCFILLTQWQ